VSSGIRGTREASACLSSGDWGQNATMTGLDASRALADAPIIGPLRTKTTALAVDTRVTGSRIASAR